MTTEQHPHAYEGQDQRDAIALDLYALSANLLSDAVLGAMRPHERGGQAIHMDSPEHYWHAYGAVGLCSTADTATLTYIGPEALEQTANIDKKLLELEIPTLFILLRTLKHHHTKYI